MSDDDTSAAACVENTRCQLFGRHFQAEKADDAAVHRLQRAVRLLGRLLGVGDVEAMLVDERGLAHWRDGAARMIKSERCRPPMVLVEIIEAGGNAR